MATPVLFPVIIVKQYERMVPFRLGKFFGLKGAGLRLLLPVHRQLPEGRSTGRRD